LRDGSEFLGRTYVGSVGGIERSEMAGMSIWRCWCLLLECEDASRGILAEVCCQLLLVLELQALNGNVEMGMRYGSKNILGIYNWF